LAAAEKLSAAAILRLTGVEVEFSKNVEAYCYNTENEMRIWPHIASDVYVAAAAVYERPTDTIRHVPSNVCLIRWVDGKPDFDLDAAAKPYRAECEEAHGEFLKSHNQRNADHENKSWLAWLLSEYIKELHPGEKPATLRTICCPGNWLESRAV
jgi:hypothetical protein